MNIDINNINEIVKKVYIVEDYEVDKKYWIYHDKIAKYLVNDKNKDDNANAWWYDIFYNDDKNYFIIHFYKNLRFT